MNTFREKTTNLMEKAPKSLKALLQAATVGFSVVSVKADTLWEVGKTASTDLFAKMKDLYCNGLFWPLLGLNLILLAFTKDDKKRGVLRYALIAIIIVYVIFNGITLLKETLDDFITGNGIN